MGWERHKKWENMMKKEKVSMRRYDKKGETIDWRKMEKVSIENTMDM